MEEMKTALMVVVGGLLIGLGIVSTTTQETPEEQCSTSSTGPGVVGDGDEIENIADRVRPPKEELSGIK